VSADTCMPTHLAACHAVLINRLAAKYNRTCLALPQTSYFSMWHSACCCTGLHWQTNNWVRGLENPDCFL
jgi:hypothetical protein